MPRGRRWTVAEKRLIVEEYESLPWGSRGALLRRRGVHHSLVARWASYRDAGVLETGLRKGWQARMTPRAESAEIGRLRAEVSRLQAQVERAHRDRLVAEAAAETLGKASALLQAMLQSADPTPTTSTDPSTTSSPSSPAASSS
jgi:hypothetical protein